MTGAMCVCGWRPAVQKKAQPDRPKVTTSPAPDDYLPRRLVMGWIHGHGSLREAIREEVPKFLAKTPRSDPDYARAEMLLARATNAREATS